LGGCFDGVLGVEEVCEVGWRAVGVGVGGIEVSWVGCDFGGRLGGALTATATEPGRGFRD